MPDARSDTNDSGDTGDTGEFFSKSWLDADAYCKDNSLGRLWGSDERFLTIDGRLEMLRNSTIPRDNNKRVCIGISRSGDGKSWRRLSDNSTVNLQGWRSGYPRSMKFSTYNYLYVQYFPKNESNVNNGRIVGLPSENCHFRCEK